MPKIEAENIAEHIRIQTNRILNAASECFREQGYRGTDMGRIAHSVGLARNSLYRYYASKDHILVACMQRDMAPFVERARHLGKDYPDPHERIAAWLDLQIDLGTGACDRTMNLIGDVREVSPFLQREIALLHAPFNEALDATVASLLKGSGREVRLVGRMITSLVRSACGEIIRGGDRDAIVRELKGSVSRILS